MSEDRTVKGGVCEEHERVRREGRGRVTMEMLQVNKFCVLTSAVELWQLQVVTILF